MSGFGIIEFIKQLRANEFLAEYDQLFLASFTEKFQSIKPTDILTSHQLDWIQGVFTDRWSSIADKPEVDYTFNPSGNNACWIKLARHLAPTIGISFLQILIPTVTNIVDPNTLQEHAENADLRMLYVGAGDKTIYSLNGLINGSIKNKVFFSYHRSEDIKKYVPHPLSLRELSRLRSKTEHVAFDIVGKHYACFWEYFIHQVVPQWQTRGEVPRQLLPPLLELISIYFAEKKSKDAHQTFFSELLIWMVYLHETHLDDVNCLYGQVIQLNGQAVYLIEILLDCMQTGDSGLDDKMLAVARWLGEYDPSLTLNIDELKGINAELNIGTEFNLSALQLCLAELHAVCSTDEQRYEITLLSCKIPYKSEVDSEIVETLRGIYERRWMRIKGQREDYTRLQEGNNKPWIRLAQLLCGGNYIKKNYYHFLMPTLTSDIDPVWLECLTNYFLSHYILAEDGKTLICLVDCEQHYKKCGSFNNCNTTPTRPLSAVEIDRIQYANSRYEKYIKHAVHGKDDVSISRETVLAVYNLVNGSLYTNGMMAFHDLTDQQTIAAGAAYHLFYNFLHQLSPLEKERLFAQRIIFKGNNVSFKKVFEDVQAYHCIAQAGQLFARLVMNYAPHFRFAPELEAKKVFHDMRADSPRKVYSDYDNIDKQEARRRIQILAVSLMNYKFHYLYIGESLSLWDSSNLLVNEIKDIYLLLKPIINSGDFKNARHIYAAIMDLVTVARRERSWLTIGYWIRSNSTQKWFDSVADNRLFLAKDAWFQPELLFITLQPTLQKNPATSLLVEAFLDDLIHTYALDQSPALKEVRVNIKFAQLLSSLDDESRQQSLQLLLSANQTVEIKVFHSACANYLVSKLVLLAANLVGSPQPGFFKTGASSRFDDIISGLGIHNLVSSTTDFLSRLFEKLSTRIDSLSKKNGNVQAKAKMRDYLNKMQCPITAVSVTTDSSPVTVVV